jgi:hypothetical protein
MHVRVPNFIYQGKTRYCLLTRMQAKSYHKDNKSFEKSGKVKTYYGNSSNT